MIQLQHLYKFLFLNLVLLISVNVSAQNLQQDSTRTITIIQAKNLRQKILNDSTVIKTLAGDAVISQGRTILSGDSIILNELTGVAEVFGNVHINDADSVNTYSNYLKYIGGTRIAYLKKNVKLTDGKATLLTDDLEYNLATGIANYQNGGKVVNGTSILTSTDATYYSDTKDVYFKKFVRLTDPKYDIKADSLLYNTQTKEAHFISKTSIKSKDGIINTTNGIYNLQTGEARFFDRTAITDSTKSITGNSIFFDDKSKVAIVEGNGKIVDSVNNVTILGGRIESKNDQFLATLKPVLIIHKTKDSTFITADTLFSGLRKLDSSSKKTVIKNDTLSNITEVNTAMPQSDSIRYFIGYNNVRIYNDSLQAVSDSMYYSTEDSVFRLFRSPVFWNDKTQVSGDTMYMFTKNQQADRLYVFNNAFVVNQSNESLFNQMGGRTLNGYFKEGNIDFIRMRGSPAESVFYPQDEDSAYVGMNRSKGDVIDIFFLTKQLHRIKFINDVDGTLYPIKQIPSDQRYLSGFQWLDKRRPKSKLEIFE